MAQTKRGFLKPKFPGTNPKNGEKKPIAGGEITAPDERRDVLEGSQIFVFTSAQNNTHVHKGFLKALETYCEDRGARLCISRFTYNKSGFQNGTKDAVDALWYDPKIAPYIVDHSASVAKGLVFCGELDILPTAVNPLSGFDNYCQHASGIIPHPRMVMKSLPGMPEDGARFNYSTGAITQRNYIQRKAGQKAEFHHIYGALVVEVEKNGTFHARQLVADNDGTFYDLTNKYTHTGKVVRNQRVEAINYGDIHIEKMDPQVYQVSFAEGGMLDELKPKYQFIHDLSDFSARNHHNRDNPFFLADQHFNQKRSVETELGLSAAFLKAVERKNTQTVVVESNHDLAYRRWLSEVNPKNDPQNARFFHESCAKMYQEIEAGNNNFNIFEWAVRRKVDLQNTLFLQENKSFVICEDTGGIECGLHGHTGPNGSRGSPSAFRSIGRRANTGHTHVAGIVDGVYTAGVTGSLDQGYNKGPSSWSHSHIVTYPNGKRAIITINKDGKWHDPSPVTPPPPASPKASGPKKVA